MPFDNDDVTKLAEQLFVAWWPRYEGDADGFKSWSHTAAKDAFDAAEAFMEYARRRRR